MNKKLQQEIQQAAEAAIQDAREMGDDLVNRAYISNRGNVVIITRETRDSNRMSNGGEYTYYTQFAPDWDGVRVYEDWSADFDRVQWLGEERFYEGETVEAKDILALAEVALKQAQV